MSWLEPKYANRQKNNCVNNIHKRYRNYNQCVAAGDNCWIAYVRNYQRTHPGITWGQALKDASPEYRSLFRQGNLRKVCAPGEPKRYRPKRVR